MKGENIWYSVSKNILKIPETSVVSLVETEQIVEEISINRFDLI